MGFGLIWVRIDGLGSAAIENEFDVIEGSVESHSKIMRRRD